MRGHAVTSVAVVTGAARGIGACTARRLAAAGFRLVLVDRGADDPRLPYALATEAELRATCDACGGDEVAVAVVGDVRDQSVLDGAVATAVERFGGVDAALAIAGGVVGGRTAWETDDADWDTMFGINFDGVRRLATAAVPAMLERPRPRHGRFIAVSSAGGTLGLPLLASYSAAKHAVVGLIRSLAAELGPEGITANAVAPGSTATAMLQASAAVYGLASPQDFASHHQLGRLVEPDEVAALLAWLCGPDSDAITGAVLPVDAGMTAS
ncbi:MAG TPA: mycofactocin-coupled SDR family oxidoreductase [Acidimicrobiales bacterium]|nr:mycofactocin-coupled SDR family oxidoreductase [Acidimicrobiales bacterium]